MNGTILQPTFLPWLGYFEMIDATDVFVVFDHVQFEKKSWQQRNRIKTANGIITLSVPVEHPCFDLRICDVKICHEQSNPLEKQWKTIGLSYKKAPYWERYRPLLEPVFLKRHVLLRDLNVELISLFCSILGIQTRVVLSSTLGLQDARMEKTEKVVNLCRAAGITKLYDAEGAQGFIDAAQFERAGIGLTFQNVVHPRYKQLWGEFASHLSVLDLILNEGENSLAIIRSGRQPSSPA